MKPKNIYLEAAMLIDSGKQEFSCVAIDNIIDRNLDNNNTYNSWERRRYATIMGSNNRGLITLDIHQTTRTKKERRKLRVLLLCMTATVCDDFKEILFDY